MSFSREETLSILISGFPCGSASKESTGSLGWEDPREKGRLPTPVFWPGEFHGYSPWGRKESNWATFTFTFILISLCLLLSWPSTKQMLDCDVTTICWMHECFPSIQEETQMTSCSRCWSSCRQSPPLAEQPLQEHKVHTWKQPVLGVVPCYRHLESLHNLWTGDLHFHFMLSPENYAGSPGCSF